MGITVKQNTENKNGIGWDREKKPLRDRHQFCSREINTSIIAALFTFLSTV